MWNIDGFKWMVMIVFKEIYDINIIFCKLGINLDISFKCRLSFIVNCLIFFVI